MDITKKILKLLKDGYSQQQISIILKEENIKPNSVSMIEKNLKNIREIYDAKTMFHLAIILTEQEYNFVEEEDKDEV